MAHLDRFAEPWGVRTPYRPEEPSPVRVYTHLAAGMDGDQVDRVAPSASILHSHGGALELALKGGRIAGVRGGAGDRANHVSY